MRSQLRLRFEQEAKLLRKSVAQVAHRDKRIQARELEIKNLEALLEAGADMKKAAEDKSTGLSQELEDTCARFSDLQEFKRYEDSRVEQRCTKMDARLDALSIDFDEELYPHMLTAIAGRRWAYDPEAEAKYVTALQALKDLKYPLVDQLEGLKDAPMDVIMAALYLESDTGGDAPHHIRDLRPSSSQLTIPAYPEKKKCCIVCRTHGVGFAHHARSDGVPVFVPTVVPQGLSILLADAATQTELEEAT
nr:hypothetical protein [Tanacetum cinerariifolium]